MTETTQFTKTPGWLDGYELRIQNPVRLYRPEQS